jgi:hypothetical protein
VPSTTRRHAHGPGRLEGLRVQITEGPALSDTETMRALRLVARLMVRSRLRDGDHEAMGGELGPCSALTVVPQPRPHQRDDAA